MDMRALAEEAERRRMSYEFDLAEERADRKAQLDAKGASGSSVAVVVRGSEEDVNDEFSYDDSEYSEENMRQAAAKRIRAAREYGHLQPAAILVDENGVMVGPKTRDKYELEAVAQGVFCWRCSDSQPDHMPDAVKESRLRTIGWSLPAGKTLKDCCATCGAILGLKAS